MRLYTVKFYCYYYTSEADYSTLDLMERKKNWLENSFPFWNLALANTENVADLYT
jgi:5'(3')-deoxyribonucleotidase